jgi:hypothetical protein
VRDVVVSYRVSGAPVVVGLTVEIPGRRRVFLSINRVVSIRPGQILTTGIINIRRFEQRAGEVRVFAELIGRSMDFRDGSGTAIIDDVAIESDANGQWDISQLYLRRAKSSALFGKAQTVFAGWGDVTPSGATGESQSAEHLIAAYSELHPVDLAVDGEAVELQGLLVAAWQPEARLGDPSCGLPRRRRRRGGGRGGGRAARMAGSKGGGSGPAAGIWCIESIGLQGVIPRLLPRD